MAKGRTIQDKLRRKELAEFVGRESQLQSFQENLRKEASDLHFANIFNVHGQGGVGKTTLLKKFEKQAQESGAVTAYTDEGVNGVVDYIASVARQLQAFGYDFSTFFQILTRYKTDKKKQEQNYPRDKNLGSILIDPVSKVRNPGSKEYFKGRLRQLIREGKIKETLSALRDVTQDQEDPYFRNATILIESKYRRHREARQMGTKLDDQHELSMNQIQITLLEMIDDLPRSITERAYPGKLGIDPALELELTGSLPIINDRADALDELRREMITTWVTQLSACAEKQRLCLFIDTYEYAGRFLESWLINFLGGQEYGGLPDDIIFIIAGRQALDIDTWRTYLSLMISLPMEPFTETEAQAYLIGKGITDPNVSQTILRLSGRLPILLATLAESPPEADISNTDPSGTAVECFLKWVEDPVKREAALLASLPRFFNLEIIAHILPQKDASQLFNWLCTMPFVQFRGGRWAYHPVVRELMVRHVHLYYLSAWKRVHKAMERYYLRQATVAGITPPDQRHRAVKWIPEKLHQLFAFPVNFTAPTLLSVLQRKKELKWIKKFVSREEAEKTHIFEYQYHRYCQDEETFQCYLINWIMVFLGRSSEIKENWVEAIHQAESDLQIGKAERWGPIIATGYEGLKNNDPQKGIELFTRMIHHPRIKMFYLYSCYYFRGRLYVDSKEYDKAIADYNLAIKKESHFWSLYDLRIDKGLLQGFLGNYRGGLITFWKSFLINPFYPDLYHYWGIFLRGAGKQKSAYLTYSIAILLTKSNAHLYLLRAELLGEMGKLEKGKHALERVVKKEPQNLKYHKRKIELLLKWGFREEAQSACKLLSQLSLESPQDFLSRSITLQKVGQIQEALVDLERAIRQDPNYTAALSWKTDLLLYMEAYEEGLKSVNQLLELEPSEADNYGRRGFIHFILDFPEKAIHDLDKGLVLEPEGSFNLLIRGLIHTALKNVMLAKQDLENFSSSIGLNNPISQKVSEFFWFSKTGEDAKAQQRKEEIQDYILESGKDEIESAWVLEGMMNFVSKQPDDFKIRFLNKNQDEFDDPEVLQGFSFMLALLIKVFPEKYHLKELLDYFQELLPNPPK